MSLSEVIFGFWNEPAFRDAVGTTLHTEGLCSLALAGRKFQVNVLNYYQDNLTSRTVSTFVVSVASSTSLLLTILLPQHFSTVFSSGKPMASIISRH